eukprot:gnl/MRDRNA2_/MRDRNA2_94602_c0_seq1.p1 gnl/MRDRNA2_/MRDRNA2_94602_c0~~gnl/MRDRNA2_/MRDRNA2_94602_c0_seq1.p1  ORF type:complete len:228 (+),score=33.50 gnl/MRDRNA2_/MRDRNA2_94602_c0_seq1:65-685(+)
MSALLGAVHAASRACRRARGITPARSSKKKERKILASSDQVIQLLPEQVSDCEGEEPTSSSSTCSGDSSYSVDSRRGSNASLPGSVDASDSECEDDDKSSKSSLSLPAPEVPPKVEHGKDPKGFRIARHLCEKVGLSRKMLCATFHAADQHLSGYLSKTELTSVFRQLGLPEADALHFFEMMGGDQRGLFWREAVAIMDPLLKQQA